MVPPQAAAGHSVWECVGNCKIHTLVSGEAGSIWILMNAGFNGVWGRIDAEEAEARFAVETPAQKEARLAELARQDAAWREAIEASKIDAKTEKWCAKSGAMKFRVPKPCKYATLFEKRICAGCGAKVPEGSDVCTAHKPATLTTAARVCGETLAGCWNHEKAHNCIFVHPDEKQWADACSGKLDVRADNRLVFCLGTDPVAMRMVGKGPAPAQTRFSHLAGKPFHGQQRNEHNHALRRPAKQRQDDGWVTAGTR
jgi:hypothetical protein